MEKEKFIKDGKFYNPKTSTLIATSNIYMSYGLKRRKIMQTTKGAYFVVEETFEGWGKNTKQTGSSLVEVLTEQKLKGMYEYTVKGGIYAMVAHGSEDTRMQLKFHKTYADLFEIEEA